MGAVTAAQLTQIMPRVDAATWTDVLNEGMEAYEIVGPLRRAAFLAQIAHESGELRRLVENLSYSASALRKAWPKRFTTEALARYYERQPEKLANYVYASRLSNGNESSGDGWRFRGRGLLQITGRSKYASTAAALELPLLENPELLEEPHLAAFSAALFWRCNGLNELADVSGDRIHDDEDFRRITKVINGGTIGIRERIRYWERAKSVLGAC